MSDTESSGGKGCLFLAALLLLFGLPGIAFGVLGYLGHPNPFDAWFSDGTTPARDLFGGMVLTLGGIIGLLIARSMNREARYWRRIRRQGLEGSARVLGCRSLGGSQNYQPRWALELRIELPNRTPFPVTRHMALPHDVASSLADRTLRVRVDPEDPTKFVIMDGLGLFGDSRGS